MLRKKNGLCILSFVLCHSVVIAQKNVLHYDGGVTLSYSYSFDNNYLCKSNDYDSYRIDVIIENNSGKKITTREVSVNHFNYYTTARIGDRCSSPEIKFVYETLEKGTRKSKYYNLLVTKGYPVPKPDHNLSFEFKEVTDNKWSSWEINQCYNQLQYRYKQIIDVGPYANMYSVDVEVKNGYSENIFFDLSLQNEKGIYIIGKHFGIRAGNSFPQRFGIGSDQKISLQVSKVCFGTDNSKAALCDAERNKASSTPPPNTYKPVTSNPYNIQPGIPNNSNGFSSTNNHSSTTAPKTTTTVPTQQLTPEEWKRVQQFELLGQQQRQIYEQNKKLEEEQQRQRQQLLIDNQLKQQQEQERLARMNQLNEEQTQRTISRMQNTPIKTFEVGKVEIKNVKRKAGSEITSTPDIEIELPEFSANDTKNAVFKDSIFKNNFERYLQQKTQRPLGKGNIPLKEIVNVGLTITEKGNIEEINIEPRNSAYVLPVINAVLLSQGKWSPAIKGKTLFSQKLSFIVKFE